MAAEVLRRICASCGGGLGASSSSCKMCGAEVTESSLLVPPLSDGRYWVAVTYRFECRSCGNSSPLDYLPSEEASCLTCGMREKQSFAAWKCFVAHAKAVGDLAGPNPEGRSRGRVEIGHLNEFRTVGHQHSFVERNIVDCGREKVLRAAPGHPLSKDKTPLEIVSLGATEIVVAGPVTGERVAYEIPPLSKKLGVLAVLAEPHAKDCHVACLEEGSSTLAITCAVCSAALTMNELKSIEIGRESCRERV